MVYIYICIYTVGDVSPMFCRVSGILCCLPQVERQQHAPWTYPVPEWRGRLGLGRLLLMRERPQQLEISLPSEMLSMCVNHQYTFSDSHIFIPVSPFHSIFIDISFQGRWELTPVAIRAGKLLAHRLFGSSHELMNYDLVHGTKSSILHYSLIVWPTSFELFLTARALTIRTVYSLLWL